MKRYPKGHHAATPSIKHTTADGTVFHLVDGKRLSKIMGQAYYRFLRWVRLRPRTGSASAFALHHARILAACINALTVAVTPFRATQPSHTAIVVLLDDPSTRPIILKQVNDLRYDLTNALRWFHAVFTPQEANLAVYYATSDHDRQRWLNQRYQLRVIWDYLNELRRLIPEAQEVLQCLNTARPTYFPHLH